MNHAETQRRLRKLDNAALRWVANDCREAMAANPDNPKNGDYQDTALYCDMELTRRAKRAR